MKSDDCPICERKILDGDDVVRVEYKTARNSGGNVTTPPTSPEYEWVHKWCLYGRRSQLGYTPTNGGGSK
jgi:hypothetical protein